MKCFVPEISWHNRDPVYSVDFQPKRGKNESFYRLASGGADFHVVIWHVTLTPGDGENHFASFECAADLQRHQKCVNVVRFAPNAEYLASGDDDGYIIVWKMREDVDPPELPGGDSDKDKESWIAWKVLRGHLQDVYDLAWSPDSTCLVSGSIDNTALLWQVEKGKKLGFLGDHKGFVQGVAWDPKGKYIATLATDRNLRVFESSKKKLIARCFKAKLPPQLVKEKDVDKEKLVKLFHSETLKTFFRRLTFTPNGDLLITPCGVLENENKNHDVSYIFTRGSYTKPAVHLPSPGLYTVAVRSSPVLYQLRGAVPSVFALPYRAVYAVATRNALVLHDTEQTLPFGYVGNIHYTGITDVTWSPDGRLVIASSSEGFCSVITFDEGEIGEEYVDPAKSEVKEVELKAGGEVIAEESTPIEIEKIDVESVSSHVEKKVEKNSNVDDTIELSSSEVESLAEEKSSSAPKLDDNHELDATIEYTLSSVNCNSHGAKMDEDEEPAVLKEISKNNTPEKNTENASCTTPTKPALETLEETPFKTPERVVRGACLPTGDTADDAYDLNASQESNVSELSICIVGDEGDLISKEEQARRLMSPYRGSPRSSSPLRRTPTMSPRGSPITPKSGRRVNLITLSSPKSKRKL